ncbi:MAG TPA: helix-turn-helix domain-containing protein [Thermogutta sp.]|nr:helix-turn-helix domain-containing protein [Thermogutta sp.]HOP78356.1 helix-turn-helix domain-containing protein [Thermogutta sp.]HQF14986.1 helix-turn-helix domain-containing protein [Thermogutta sp.]
MNTPEPLAYRLKDAARILGLSTRTVWQLAHDGQIPCVRVGTGRRKTLLFPADALKAWLLERAKEDRAGDPGNTTEDGLNDR